MEVLGFYRRIVHGYGGLSLWGKGLLVAAFAVVTSAFAVAVVVSLPEDHFTRAPRPHPSWRQFIVLRWTWLLVKNSLGMVILPLGVIMALPLVPGPGLVFILVGLSLLDFPGKRSLERRLLGLPRVLRFLNDVRQRFGKAPLTWEP